jgi:hypothetical protein
LWRLTRHGAQVRREPLMPCVFVPLIGTGGWAGQE